MPEGIDGKHVDECETKVAARDFCVVDSKPLAGVLLPFIETWGRDQRSRSGGVGGGRAGGIQSITATAWLAEESGVSRGTIEMIAIRDTVTGEPKPRTTTTELRIADRLVTAIQREDAFWDGTLEVHANPNAKKSVQSFCCGGSERLRGR